ncbi:integrase catalytic domain-containing protein [Trichonephila inaurata madagascariensis]|uniref:Integrase catalytic domain-containing protein n=1 Tax=Trichonephila inaurata madagascariensis TaxID=2747483 RepID=A0A8X6XKP7_9ARAC|nr:integrase catalytic domain-containing protein [Trichonephila inaurata madagascariensis]
MKKAAGRIKADVSELYHLLKSELKALESLGRTKEKFSEFLEPLVESCLPETVLRAKEHNIELLLEANVIENILTAKSMKLSTGVTCYLPINQDSQAMKIRPVFNQRKRNRSNKGSNLIKLILDVIDRFMLYPIDLSSDIEKAFLQLSIIPENRDYLRFLLPTLEETKI